MPDPQIRTWTIEGWDYNTLSHGRITDGKRLDQGEQVRVVEAAPVIAALHQIEAAIRIGKGLALHEVQELRRAVSDE